MQATLNTRFVLAGSLLWITVALTLGASGVLATIRPPAPQLLIAALTVATIWLTSRGPLRAAVDALPMRSLLAVHLVRFVGIAFLVMSAQGILSPLFATRAGWGDIAAAATAMGLMVAGAPTTSARRRWYFAWSIFATLDLLVAVGTATFVAARGDTPGVEPLLVAPNVLVPLFVVPVLFASHVAIFRRLRQPVT